MKKYLVRFLTPVFLLTACQTAPSPESASLPPQGEWQIVRIDDTPVTDSRYSLHFDTQQMAAAVYFGCNRIHAAYTVDGERIRFGHVASTKMYCGRNTDKDRGLQALAQISRWQVAAAKTVGGRRLTLFDDAGRPRLEAQPR